MILQQTGDVVVGALTQELTPTLTGELPPVTEVIAVLGTEPPRMIVSLLNRHVFPLVDVYSQEAADLSTVAR